MTSTVFNNTNIIIARGKSLFLSKMNSSPTLTSEEKSKLDLLISLFQDQVSIMEIIDKNGKKYYSAIKLSKACENVITNKNILLEDAYNEAIVEYNKIIDLCNVTAQNINENIVKNLNNEISSHDIIVEKINTTDDNGTKINFTGEHIDLITDILPEDLRTEGKRRLGLLPADFNSITDDENKHVVNISEENTVISVNYDEDGNLFLSCPKCASRDIVIEMSSVICLNCDGVFVAPFNLADRLDDDFTVNSSNSFIDSFVGNIARINVNENKRNRGKII